MITGLGAGEVSTAMGYQASVIGGSIRVILSGGQGAGHAAHCERVIVERGILGGRSSTISGEVIVLLLWSELSNRGNIAKSTRSVCCRRYVGFLSGGSTSGSRSWKWL